MEKNKTVLIVDDEEEICLLLKRFLSRRYGSVLVYHTLKDGLKATSSKKFDYLFLDNNLPDGTGIDHIHDFKKSCDKIVVISAMTNLESKAIQSGADFFIGKPVSFTAIEKALS